MKLAIAGAAGRMGRVLTRIINETPGAEVAGGLEHAGSPHVGADMGVLAGIGALDVAVTDDPIALLTHVDGIIDFTVPAATLALTELAAQARIVHVIGTTGIDAAGEAKIKAAARHARIVKSGNMSLGVNLLAVMVKKVAAALGEDFDIEVLEMHHRHKIDAPSGTALLLGQAAAAGRQINLAERSVRSRDGHTGARPQGDIGFATLRGGSVVGEHTVMFAGAAERIELTHKAESRDIFARGAVRAALWAFDKKPGLYSMTDVLGLE
ncbi:4-hydroxy-tetrahydrodipicolinate reductase [Aestuariivirga sp.]|uniref:4-hydroxy-tetrahydrodipicolinate reductase n=1 Tax=Aestuariivirga sp. TaxID=2650926 RepID=UPI003BA86F7F